MARFNVFEAQEQLICRKWLHLIDAQNEQEAIARVIAEDWTSDPADLGELGEPDYCDSGFVARPEHADENGVWEAAVSDLVIRKRHDSAVHYMQKALAHILVLVRQGDPNLAAIETHCTEALGRAWGIPPENIGTPDLAVFPIWH